MTSGSNTLLLERWISLGFMLVSILAAVGFARYEIRRFDIHEANLQSSLDLIENTNVFFFTEAIRDMAHTWVSLSYDFHEAEPQVIWLKMASPAETPISRLVYHPTLASLDWFVVSDHAVSLWQREQQYTDLVSFLESPPPAATIAIEHDLSMSQPYTNLGGTPFEDELSLQGIDYVLTTFKRGEYDGGFYTYTTSLDASTAIIDDKNRLSWQIYAPTATPEAPIKVGNLKIDYRQAE